jgi:hypothetical protein
LRIRNDCNGLYEVPFRPRWIGQWVCSAAASLRISTGLQAEIAAPASRPLPGFKDCKVYPEILQRLF